MSDYGRIQEANALFKAENDRLLEENAALKADIAAAHAFLVDSSVPDYDRVYNATAVLSRCLGVPAPKEPMPAILDDDVAKLDVAIGRAG